MARRAPEGGRLRYAFADTSFGPLLLAESKRGLAWLSFVDSEEAALDELRRHFPHCTIEPADAEGTASIGNAVAAVELLGQKPLPTLDLGGTPFQRAVWDALLAIPFGETKSYSQVASAIGRPTAVRAVAQACGANPVAILVPCHRVLGADGSLTGYASGLEHKRVLLEREGWRADAL